LTEANLGMLGLGVAEPLPSWGSLLRELESCSTGITHAAVLAPLVLVILTVSSFQLAVRKKEISA
jgi:peptide/nickel transport system permease protein